MSSADCSILKPPPQPRLLKLFVLRTKKREIKTEMQEFDFIFYLQFFFLRLKCLIATFVHHTRALQVRRWPVGSREEVWRVMLVQALVAGQFPGM